MAQKVNIVLVDDLDGADATETVSFGLDGASYEIDLNDKNAATLREALAGYVGVGRKVGGRLAPRGRDDRPHSVRAASEIRDWARRNGYDVSDRGRVSAEVVRRSTPPTDVLYGEERRPVVCRQPRLGTSDGSAYFRRGRATGGVFAESGAGMRGYRERVGCSRG